MGQKLDPKDYPGRDAGDLSTTGAGLAIALDLALQRLAELGHAREIEPIRRQAIQQVMTSMSTSLSIAPSDQIESTTGAINIAFRHARRTLRRKPR